MSQTTEQKVQDYKDSLKTKAEKLILVGFPQKILELNELLETPQFRDRQFTDVHQELNVPVPDPIVLNNHEDLQIAKKRKSEYSLAEGSKVMAVTSGAIPCNQALCELIHLVKPHIRQLVEHSNQLKMWISFMIPKIEDGNNFGVSIQEDTLAEVQSVESEAAAFFDQISRYFISRGKIVSKVAKYPHISDYRRAVQELDEKEYLSLWLVLSEVRNRYCSLHDIVIKNLEKIKKPRSSNAESLY
ncbi:proteasome activator complex subunit 3 isoform X2 [Chrysoperla carnea]|uniref:proteasome activator complex subunit 3 isoform X2 n=1 Tax=Chrysoperla carnea TaxID=189513 RepID=UPI001D06E06F|nr:proteasome activator complex subunit 3 isoform X2 [Chrysoperla carnea]